MLCALYICQYEEKTCRVIKGFYFFHLGVRKLARSIYLHLRSQHSSCSPPAHYCPWSSRRPEIHQCPHQPRNRPSWPRSTLCFPATTGAEEKAAPAQKAQVIEVNRWSHWPGSTSGHYDMIPNLQIPATKHPISSR